MFVVGHLKDCTFTPRTPQKDPYSKLIIRPTELEGAINSEWWIDHGHVGQSFRYSRPIQPNISAIEDGIADTC